MLKIKHLLFVSIIAMFLIAGMSGIGYSKPVSDGDNVLEGKKAVFIITDLEMEPWYLFKAYLEANGVEVDLAAHSNRRVMGCPSACFGGISPDLTINEINPKDYDAIVLAGGGPVPALLGARDEKLMQLIRKFDEKGKVIGAFCANSTVLEKAGIFEGKGTPPPPCPFPGTFRIGDNIVVGATPISWPSFSKYLVECMEENAIQNGR